MPDSSLHPFYQLVQKAINTPDYFGHFVEFKECVAKLPPDSISALVEWSEGRATFDLSFSTSFPDASDSIGSLSACLGMRFPKEAVDAARTATPVAYWRLAYLLLGAGTVEARMLLEKWIDEELPPHTRDGLVFVLSQFPAASNQPLHPDALTRAGERRR